MERLAGTLFVITPDSAEYRNNLFYDEVRKGINLAANLAGFNVEFLSGFRQDAELFSEANGLLFSPDGSPQCRDFVSAVKDKFAIPLVQIDNQVFTENLAPPFDAFIGPDNLYGGEITAQYLKSFFAAGSKVLVIAGSKELPYLSYNLRLDGFLAGSNGHFELLDVIYGDFNHRLVYNRLHEYLIGTSIHPELIFAFNDDSAIVAHKVLQELNVDPLPVLAGFDGSAAGRVALSKKQIVCSYDQNPENLGRKAVRLFLDLKQGDGIASIDLIRATLLTQNNIGNTFYAGVTNLLDRTLTPFTFRKRRYEIHSVDTLRSRPLSTFRNELVCPIFMGDRNDLPEKLAQIDADKFFVVSDDNQFLRTQRLNLKQLLNQKGLAAFELGFSEGEHNKNLTTVMTLLDALLSLKISKKSCLVLIGGGITGNLGGFAASILYRGIKFVHVPTTLMHMVDSSTGGKQAVDSTFGKNSIGNFYEPEFIFIDRTFLETLPDREIRSGLAECIKHALCQDRNFYEYILNRSHALISQRDMADWQQIIERTVRLKLDVLEKDSYELNEGMALVYGHTLGHAIESASGYKLTHGESISIGMFAAAKIATRLGLCSHSLLNEHERILATLGLPVAIPKEIESTDIIKFLTYDKKHVDQPMTFVLLEQVGQLYMNRGIVPYRVPDKLVETVVHELNETS